MTTDISREATAKAIYRARFGHRVPRDVTEWEKLPEDAKDVWRRCAQASLWNQEAEHMKPSWPNNGDGL